MLCAMATLAHAQIRGRPTVGGQAPRGPSQGWWVSGGAAGVVMGTITDGASSARWEFGTTPQWQARGTIEKALDIATTLGVSAGYGVMNVNVSRLAVPGQVAPDPRAVCINRCDAQLETWQLMGQFRSGGGPGFHTYFEAQGGVNGFRNLRTRDSTAAPIGPSTTQMDFAGSLGFGFGYTLSPGLVLGLVQDFGMGWHSQEKLPSDASRTYRTRATRATLRFKF